MKAIFTDECLDTYQILTKLPTAARRRERGNLDYQTLRVLAGLVQKLVDNEHMTDEDFRKAMRNCCAGMNQPEE